MLKDHANDLPKKPAYPWKHYAYKELARWTLVSPVNEGAYVIPLMLAKDQSAWFAYNLIGNASSLGIYDAVYKCVSDEYPDWNKLQIGAYTSLIAMPLSQLFAVPADTIATRIMSIDKSPKLAPRELFAVFGMNNLWKLFENGALLILSYWIKDLILREKINKNNKLSFFSETTEQSTGDEKQLSLLNKRT